MYQLSLEYFQYIKSRRQIIRLVIIKPVISLTVSLTVSLPPSAQDSPRTEPHGGAAVREHGHGGGQVVPDSYVLGRRGQSHHYADRPRLVLETVPESVPDGPHL